MAQQQIIQNVKGYFDVKEYNAKKPREQWNIKGNDTTIMFGVKYEGLPEQFKQYAKAYTTRNNTTAYMVKFKIGQNCKWYDKTKAACPRPSNDYLDGKLFELTIAYATLNGNPDLKEASGYWCNAIMFREVEKDPFEGIAAFEEASVTPAPEPTQTVEAQLTPAPEQPATPSFEYELPF